MSTELCDGSGEDVPVMYMVGRIFPWMVICRECGREFETKGPVPEHPKDGDQNGEDQAQSGP